MRFFSFILLVSFTLLSSSFAKILNIENKIQIEVPSSHKFIRYNNEEITESINELKDSIEEVLQYVNYWDEHRHDLPYETDGVVVKVNDFHQQDELGSNSPGVCSGGGRGDPPETLKSLTGNPLSYNGEDRTHDLPLTGMMLCQLSYPRSFLRKQLHIMYYEQLYIYVIYYNVT